MRVLVTGGAGFIGGALVWHLVAERGADLCIMDELGWRPRIDFASGIASTVAWYAANAGWCATAHHTYDGARLGLKEREGVMSVAADGFP